MNPVRDLVVDTHQRRVFFAGEEIVLTRSELLLLSCLAREKGCIVSQERLAGAIFDDPTSVTSNAIEVHLSNLRKKLRAAGASSLIETRRGLGYLLR